MSMIRYITDKSKKQNKSTLYDVKIQPKHYFERDGNTENYLVYCQKTGGSFYTNIWKKNRKKYECPCCGAVSIKELNE